MSITSSNVAAKAAAVVAGLGLVFASFAPATRAASSADLDAQIAALMAQINALKGQLGTTQTTAMFNVDLTIGSTGADVTALQNWLIAKGYSIPAGATGYFGAQTAAALGQYQAANGISPAAGYFGPITRAKVNASAGTTTGGTTTGGTTTTGGLSGGEADIDGNFDLRAGEDINEGDSNVEIATAKFDVSGGDVSVQRVKVVFQAASMTTSIDSKPWQYFDSLAVYANGKKIGDADAGSKSDWDSDNANIDFNAGVSGSDYYTITIDTNGVLKEGDNAELSIHADAQGSFDDDSQSFEVTIPEQGIRAVDAEGIQQYTGDDSDHVTVGLGSEESGDLSLRESDENPDAAILVADDTDTSDEFTVFAFDVKNKDEADALFDDITIDSTVTGASTTDLRNVVRDATLTIDGDSYDGDIASTSIGFDDLDTTIDGDSTVTGVLTVKLYGQENHYAPNGQKVFFSLAAAKVNAEGADSGDDATVSGSVTGNTHSILLSGIDVAAKSTAQSVTTPGTDSTKSYGTFTIKFDVTAVEDDAYVATTTATSGTSAGVVYAITGTAFTGTTSALVTSTADLSGAFYKVDEGSTETFTLTVTLDPAATGTYEVDLKSVNFNDSAAAADSSFTVDSGNDDFKTDPVTIAN